jgi:hypothetical protein
VPKPRSNSQRQVVALSDLRPTCKYRVVALDPSVRGSDNRILTAEIEIPNEQLSPGPRGFVLPLPLEGD